MANIELDGTNKKIKVDSGDLTLDVPGDIILDADGADLTFADGGTNILKITNSSSDVVFQNQVDAKDIIFKQYDGTEVAKIDDDGSFKVANSTLSISQSSSDVIIKPLTDAKDIFFQQYDGRTLLDINDGGYVAIANGATGPGQLRLYEDTDNGTNYTALQVGTQSGDITYTLPTADGSNGHALTTNGSGTLSWASAGTTYAGIDDQSSSNDDQITIADSIVTINEDSDDVDFRVESNGKTHMLFVDGGSDQVKIGADEGAGELNVSGSGTVAMSNSFYSDSHSDVVSNPCIEIKNSDTTDNNFSSIVFVESSDKVNGAISVTNGNPGGDGGGCIVFTTRNTGDSSDTLTNCGRFDSIGNFMVGSSNLSYADTKGSYMDYSGELVAHVDTSNAGPILFAGYSSHGGTQEAKFRVTADGSVNSRNNNFESFSDERLKKDIVDANSQWNDVKAFKFKNFKLKSIDGTDNAKQLGVIAQDLESISPNLVTEVDPTVPDILISSEFGEAEDDLDRPKIYDNPENLPSGKNIGDPMLDGSGNQLYKKKIKSLTGKKVKSVKYSVLYMKAIKALQEAQTRIETLETKVAALEG